MWKDCDHLCIIALVNAIGRFNNFIKKNYMGSENFFQKKSPRF